MGAETLLDDVWEDPEASTVASLHVSVSKLRKALDPTRRAGDTSPLVSRSGGYALSLRTDADELEDGARRAARLLEDGSIEEARELLVGARSRWRGAPYEDIGEHAWLVLERRRCEELRVYVAELYAESMLRQKPGGGDVVLDLHQLVDRHPARERLAMLLAVALHREQRQDDALAVLRSVRDHLRDASGLDPGPELHRAEERILAQEPDQFAGAGRAPATVPAGPKVPTLDAMLLGRGRQRAVLDAAAATASAGQSTTTVILGEAGIGKTQLARTLAEGLRTQGWHVVWSHANEEEGAPALWPWLSLVRQLGQTTPLSPELAALVDEDAVPTSPAEAASDRWRQAARIGDLLETAAKQTPLLVVLDDLHWADAASQALLVELTDRSPTARLLLVVTSRPEGSPSLTTTLANLTRLGVRRLVLDRLGDSDVQAMAAGAGVEVDARALRERTRGNPFLLKETLAFAAETGSSPLDVVPSSVTDVLGARMARLPGHGEEVLLVGAVLGGVSDAEAVAQLAGLDQDEVDDALDSALRAGLLESAPSGVVAFSHDLVRETAYQRLGPVRRARLHGRALALFDAAGGRNPAQLARHASLAGPSCAVAAVRWAIRAAEQSADRRAPDSALEWWRVARGAALAAPDRDDERRVRVLLGLTNAQLDAGDLVGAVETRAEAVEASTSLGDSGALIAALTSVSRSLVWLPRRMGQVNAAVLPQLEHALTLASSPLERCRLLATLAVELYAPGQAARCDELTSEAVRIAERLDDPAALAFAINARIAATAYPRREAARAVEADRLVELGRSAGLPSVELAGHQFGCRLRLQLFEVRAADAHAARARHLAGELRLPLPALQQALWDCSRRALEGDVAGALETVDELAGREWPWWHREAMLATVRLTLLLRSGDLDGVEPLVTLAATVSPTIARAAQTLVDLQLRRPPTSPADPLAPVEDWSWLASACIHAQAMLARGDSSAIRDAYDALLPGSGMIASTGSFDAGPVDGYLADLAAALGATEQERSHRELLASLSAREQLV